MPLLPGNSRSVIGSNIREMVRAGHPPRVAVAASLSNASRHPNDAGIGGRSVAPKMHMNDVGVSARIQKLPMVPSRGNDVGLGIGKISGKAAASGVRNMSSAELHSRRGEIGRMPRA